MITSLFGNAIQFLSNTEHPSSWFVDWYNGGEQTSSGEHINEENALRVPALKAAVSVLSEAMRVISLDVYRVEKSGRHTQVSDHEVQQLLWRVANPETDANTWMETVQTSTCLWGNGYSTIQRTLSGKPIAFWQRSSKPERTALTRNPKDSKLLYELRDENGKQQDSIPATDMLHIKGISLDGLVGLSSVSLLRETVGGSRAAQRVANELFKNHGAPSGFLTHPQKLGDAAYQRLKASMAAKAEHGKRHETQILEEGMTFSEANFDPSRLQLLDARLFMVREIACFFRIPPHLLQELTFGTFSNITELGRQFVTYTMTPWCNRWTSEINLKVLKAPYICKPNFSAFLQADQQARANYHRTMLGVGVESIDEARIAEGMNPLDMPMSDEHFVPLNMVPLSQAGAGQQAPSEPPPGSPPVGDGVTPSNPTQPKAHEEPDTEGKLEKARSAAEAVLSETIARMERIEANAVLRAAKDPAKFLTSVDGFYLKHLDTLTDAIRLPTESVEASGGRDSSDAIADAVASMDARHQMVVATSECSSSELAERMQQCVETWGKANIQQTNPQGE